MINNNQHNWPNKLYSPIRIYNIEENGEYTYLYTTESYPDKVYALQDISLILSEFSNLAAFENF
jgi:hypothetical protein